jgi:hypothetical protein
MKRRDFVTKLLGCTAAIGAGSVSIISAVRSSSEILVPYDKNYAEKNSDKFTLPDSPVEYVSMISITVNQGELPKIIASSDNIHGQPMDYIINQAGSYNIQYLGDYYGWNII